MMNMYTWCSRDMKLGSPHPRPHLGTHTMCFIISPYWIAKSRKHTFSDPPEVSDAMFSISKFNYLKNAPEQRLDHK